MNIKAEANRLAGCVGMERESFTEEVLAALENAYAAGYEKRATEENDCLKKVRK